jgi:hypothetical protein
MSTGIGRNALEVDNSHKDGKNGDEVHHIEHVLMVESLFHSSRLTPCKQQVK